VVSARCSEAIKASADDASTRSERPGRAVGAVAVFGNVGLSRSVRANDADSGRDGVLVRGATASVVAPRARVRSASGVVETSEEHATSASETAAARKVLFMVEP
jgi:hypothetical protein